MDRRQRALVLVGLGVVIIGGTLAVSAATAPDLSVEDDGRPQTLVGSQGGGPGWHELGSVYLLDGSNIEWREDSAGSYFDVTMLDNGSVMAGFMHSGYEEGCGPYEAPCAKTGFRIIDPDADGGPQVVSEYSFPVRSQGNSEVHDVEQLDSGEYLLTDMDAERIVTVENGEETWEWRASDFYNPPEDPTRRDWLHINDVDVINETHYLVSVRNANQLVIVERGAGVVEVINEDDDETDESCLIRGTQLVPDDDGDVRCGDPDVLNHQHNPQWLGNGAVLVADSDNDRVVELRRTDDGWEPVWTLERAGDIALNWPRDADRLPDGNTLVTDTLNKRIIEVDEDGEVVWSTTTAVVPYEADRLPLGERAGVPAHGADTDGETGVDDSENSDVPLLSPAVVGIKAVVPWLPYWVGEIQIVVGIISPALVVAGVVLRRRS